MRKSSKLYLVLLILAVLSLAVVDYMTLPAWNFQSFGFWFLLALYVALFAFLLGNLLGLRRAGLLGAGAAILLVLVALGASATSWLVWPGNAARYYAQLAVTEEEGQAFSKDFPDGLSSTARGESIILPRTDKQLSIATAQGKMGTYGARFHLDSGIFTSIAIRREGETKLVRVSPLEYSGFLVALTGGSKGTAGYIEVDQIGEQGRLVPVEGGMVYTPGAVFSHKLDRLLRFRYRSYLFGAKSFEIDDSGRPWWVVPVLRNSVGLFGGPTARGIVLVNPSSGHSEFYAPGAEPSWVDRVYPTEVVITQANNRLRLGNGWINATIGQKKDVFQLSDSYNYVVSEGKDGPHAWLVSGVTSPSEADQTLVGFMTINLKTGEARRYALSGITEMRAMEIAQNDERVRAQALQATWPILVDVDGEPAYYLFLKNSVQRQRFVYVDLSSGQKVAMGETIEAAKSDFARMQGSRTVAPEDLRTAAGKVLRVKDSPEDRSVLFILAGEPGSLYSASAELSNGIRFMAPGDKVRLSYRETTSMGGKRFVLSLENETIGK